MLFGLQITLRMRCMGKKKDIAKNQPTKQKDRWFTRWLNSLNEGKPSRRRASTTYSLRTILGLIILATFLFVLWALVCYVLDSKSMYSALHSQVSDEAEYSAVGRWGVQIGYIFFNRLFGWASFFASLLFLLFSVVLLWPKWQSFFQVLGRLTQILLVTLTTSLCLSALQRWLGSGDATLYWGGELGLMYQSYISVHLGNVGLLLVVLLCILITASICSSRVIIAINQPPQRPDLGKFKAYLSNLRRWRKESSKKQTEEQSELEFQPEDNGLDAYELLGDNASLEDLDSEKDTEEIQKNLHLSAELPQGEHPSILVELAPQDELVDEIIDHTAYTPGLMLRHYRKPSIELLQEYGASNVAVDKEEIEATKQRILDTLASFKIQVMPHKATVGPTVTLYEVIPEQGVKVARISGLVDDLALSLKSEGIRIIAPMPGQGTVGIEVPNGRPQTVSMRSIMASRRFSEELERMELPVGIGKTITNEPFVFDLTKMPHLLIAGATGQGKSVGLNAMITSLLYSKRPEELKFVMVDPKMLEFSLYEELENHFMATLPDADRTIITDMSRVVPTLNSLCVEMDNRYELLTRARVRNIKEYNQQVCEGVLSRLDGFEFLPYIVLIVDEFADLIMTRGKEVEQPIARLAQKARAAGIHMVIATQRPSTDVITGLIKANFPARIAFKVFSMVDSRTILDSPGANQLIGRGDMLFYQGKEMIRIQCAFMDTPETQAIVEHIRAQESEGRPYQLPEYVSEGDAGEQKDFNPKRKDALFEDAARLVVTAQVGSASVIQRKLEVGFARAGRIVDQLEGAGILGPQKGSKPRDILVQDLSALEELLDRLR